MTSSGGVSKFNILLSKNTTFWINGILNLMPGSVFTLLTWPNCKTSAFSLSSTTNTDEIVPKNIIATNINNMKDYIINSFILHDNNTLIDI